MKKFHFILLLAIFACSPDNEEAIVEQQSTSSDTPESMNLESGPALNRDSGNLIYKETFENPVNSIKLSNCFFEKFLIFFSGPKPYALTKDPTVGSKKP